MLDQVRAKLDPASPEEPESTLNKPVFFISAGLIIAVCLYGALFSDHASLVFSDLQSWLLTNLGWLYMGSVAGFFMLVIYLAFSRFAHLRLGADDSEPEYSYGSWFAMLFSAGMGIGLMFFGVSEPMTHFLEPPVGEGGTIDAARNAMQVTFFHWGLHAWAIYIIIGLALAYFSFRHDLPLTLRSALYPVIGDKIYGKWGNAVDIFAILGTMFGVATSLGLGVMQVNAGLNYLFGLPVSIVVQVALIAAITCAATISVVAGLDAGIRRLSELNLVLALLLMVFVLIAGPTVMLLSSLIQNIGMYLSGLVDMTFRIYAYEPNEWIGNWTLFYWAWWISWSPFVGMFIARISRGRTIREFILGVLLVPSGFTFLWLTIFGNSGLWLEMHEAGAGLATAVQTNMPTAIFVLLDQLPLTGITSALATMLIVTFFVTSSDSGSLVIDIISSGGAENPPVWQRIFWAVSEGAVAATLLVAGGLAALQTAAISSALPLIIVMFLVCYGLMKALHAEPSVRGVRPIATSSVPVAGGSKAWQSRLKAMLGRFKEGEAQAYLETTARQAMEEVLAQLTTQNILHAGIEAEENLIRLTAGQGEEFDFLYEIKLREYSLPSVAFPELPTKKSERNYWRAEVTLLEGAQQYDVAGYSKEELMSDILTQFENHLHLLHTDI
ncbi:BCCT family transporter [Gammaproteobacteria bacterium]|nr:BCCT family transporter [Gammaproteobacteria bacterium]MDA7782879.1 BCCT family transporter [Gammaproteobacteria bacterium]MDA8927758.1 BCCT family transporter [Gammaproteobacteria bacterium]MDA9567673.1 BCCT family transporter [Gammaproteobacteria bacterium]MDA9871103.1 BCCT family transporter [Gammaproteobacteria bacterium]